MESGASDATADGGRAARGHTARERRGVEQRGVEQCGVEQRDGWLRVFGSGLCGSERCGDAGDATTSAGRAAARAQVRVCGSEQRERRSSCAVERAARSWVARQH